MAGKIKFTDHLLWAVIAVGAYALAVCTSPIWVPVPLWLHRKTWLDDRVKWRESKTFASPEAQRASRWVM